MGGAQVSALAVEGRCGHSYVGNTCPRCARRAKWMAVREQGWIGLKEAAVILGLKTADDAARFDGLPQRLLITQAPCRPPVMLRRRDVERVALIARECGVRVRVAVRMVVAELEGRI